MKDQFIAAGEIDTSREDVRDSRGRRVTDEYIAGAVADAEQQLRGRPSLTAPGRRSPQISFRVPTPLAARAQELADRTKSTVSQVSRRALEEYLDRHAG